MTELEPLTLALLCLAALAAGFVDAIAGGGGLLTMPALLGAGLPPHLALGTNKGQSVFGAAIALWRFQRSGLVDARRAVFTFPAGLAGAAAGAALVLALRPEVLRPVILVLLVAVAIHLAVRRPPRAATAKPLDAVAPLKPLLAVAVALAIGAYDGFFGPGTGTFLIVAFAVLAGDGLAAASGNAKVVNFASNLASVSLFASRGVVLWEVALPMAAAQVLGAWFGAHSAIRGGDVLVRRVVLLVVVALCLKIGVDLLRA